MYYNAYFKAPVAVQVCLFFATFCESSATMKLYIHYYYLHEITFSAFLYI